MVLRLTRAEQHERNRALVLAAARRLFLARGYHAATLEQIAEEAGFSKGVVYSQFEGKADLFLALLEARIEERAAQNARVTEGVSGERGLAMLIEHVARVDREEPEWGLLVIEFRVLAARDPVLNARYAAAHARTLQALGRVVGGVYERAGEHPPLAPIEMARMLLAFGAGMGLEQAADPGAVAGPLAVELLARVTAPPSDTTRKEASRRRRVS